ncbi:MULTISPECIES: tyrosine-type recombinase/integrase [Aeromonas]|uniref:tyrosine-type recombinase/integrase n=1 Tax=Aeromonas TaxID=642 RepID=UPI00191DBE40|nr:MULTISPECIES: integrase arm-type DNA-binding domain-containing protein [Aeromonas]MBL0647338.1 tyrosine-type recombinase/integrase [Aeromonas caviae]MCY9815174.1 tyrosine-type recombinase/integrase [Aeromonas caviae]MDX7762542.1 tyrosine-type recombinase/integrase [Aeromonas caviae]MDX7861036.1 tyrosine-type recombinase/integrase [Aeromonas caviae]WEA30830.1 tyrosine-type recombinase/integrase [Aeromonas hydrophila]
MPLSDITARQAKYTGKPQKLSDEKGLFLLVNQSGKYWRLKYRHGGKEKTLALGVYPEVSLKEARAKRDEARRLIAEGVDPGLVKKQSKIANKLASENNFEALAREWHHSQLALWSPGHATRVIESLEVDAFPDLGIVPVTELTAPMILEALRKVEKRGATETAGRILQRISAIMRYAIQTGRASYNPAQDLKGALKATKQEHRPALPRSELPEFFRRLEAEPLNPATRLALHLLMLTMTRPGEVRFARWDEFDMERAEWRIPAARMKMRTEHLVPLSRQALAVLDELRQLTGHCELLFPSERKLTNPMSENTLSYAMGRMGYKGIACPHGFRALASTTLNEEGFDPDVIERQLAHAERNKVRAAYHRAEYLDDRRKLLQWLADFYDSQRGSNVLPVNFNRVG